MNNQPSTFPFNPADPDAPLLALMDIQSNPELLARADEPGFLEAVLDKLKSYQVPATLSAKLTREALGTKTSAAAAERKAKLDKLMNL